ncbi:MAG: GMC oxidoreductase [Flavobacteriales bacterium]|jgi:choline dehydrogenase-like flavoprotein|tara:strand:+ start:14210 stop:15907 length:1698 start_codon:yes stop_codon:yes gene_type:complete
MKNNLNNQFDAIVIGSGISGGWAAKELCENGLKTLVLERGRMVKHIEDYPTMHKDPWDSELRGRLSNKDKVDYKKQSRWWGMGENNKHFYNVDSQHDYDEVKPFNWIRGSQVGGRSLIWGRQTYRWSDLDFKANAKDGFGVDWPIRYKDIEPWYDYVEKTIGVSGEKLNLKHLPDSKFLKPMELNCLEEHLKSSISDNYSDRLLTIGRVAHLTEDIGSNKRSKCQHRNRCDRGCPFGGYFSSNSSTLPFAEDTGNLTLKPNSIVSEIIYDDKTKKAKGVRVIDSITKNVIEYQSRIIFLCASAIASSAILLQSRSKRFPNGLGNDSGELGHNIMDHQLGSGASGKYDGFKDKYYYGNRPNGFYVPRFRNIDQKSINKNFLRGYGYQGGASRSDWSSVINEISFGKKFKEEILKPGDWTIGMGGFGEVLPYHENKMFLNYEKTDQWGLPTIVIDAEFKENEKIMKKDWNNQAAEMLELAGYHDVKIFDGNATIGGGIHEMGTARMGKDPKTSILNKFNQIHNVKNIFVTDGSCMTSSATQNPSLTYMALTARAANYAVSEIKKKNL